MSLKALIARLMFKLPPTWLYRLAGGAPIEINGKQMDPHCQFMVHAAARGPSVADIGVQAFRDATSEGASLVPSPPVPGVLKRDSSIDLPGRSVPVRIYRPEQQDPNASVLVYFHSGGGVIGDLDFCDTFCAMLCAEGQRPVISVDYRLAPENKWPAGLEDAIEAYKWALGQAEGLDAPPGRACVGGDSMGGNFAAIICQQMKLEGAPMPDFQLLIYPATHIGLETQSMHDFGGIYPLTQEVMDFFMANYLPEGADKDDLRLSPLTSTDMHDLPPAIVVTAGFDALLDQGKLYHDRLVDAGVTSVYRCFDSLVHGFTAMIGPSPAAARACRDIAKMTTGFGD